jgi:hypothetical protein
MSNKPIKTFRHGAIGLSVWERRGRNGVFYDFTLSRSYKGGDGGTSYTLTFREDNGEAIVRVVNDATAWIRMTAGRAHAAAESLNQAIEDHAAGANLTGEV